MRLLLYFSKKKNLNEVRVDTSKPSLKLVDCGSKLHSYRWILLETRTHNLMINQHNSFNRGCLSTTDQKCADSSTYWQFFNYQPGRFRYTTVFSGRDRENMMPKTRYIAICAYIYILIFSIVDLFSISIGNTKNHVATLICLEWRSVKICLTYPL